MPTIVGKDDQAKKRITCRNCASVLEYVPAEERRDYSTDYTGGKDYFSYVICPCCGKQVVTRGY